jgi:hypothetical protein
MSDIEVVLGAKNEASAVLKQVSADVARTSQDISLSFKGILQVAGITAAIAALRSTQQQLTSFATEAISAFDKVNNSGKQLEDTLLILNQGGAANALKSVASSLENISNVNESAILDQMSKALRLGTSVGQVDDLAAAAVGLSKVFDTDLSTAMRMAQSATEGNFESFEGLIPKINSLVTADEKLAAVSQLASQGLSDKSEKAKSAAEAGNRMSIAWNNVYTSIGTVLAPIRDVVFNGLAYVADVVNQIVLPAISAFIAYTLEMAKAIGDNMHFIAESAVVAFSVLQTIFTNMGPIFDIAVNSIALSLEGMRADFEHVFTVVIPAYGKWFSDNFLSILRDVAVAASHIVENMLINIANIIQGKPLVGLLDGFEATVAELPKIAERGTTEVEKVLRGNIEKSMNGVMESFDKNKAKNLQLLNELPGQIKTALPKIELGIKATADKDGLAGLGGGRQGESQLQAVESRLLTRGSTQDTPLQKIVENTAKTADGVKKVEIKLDNQRYNQQPQMNIKVVA